MFVDKLSVNFPYPATTFSLIFTKLKKGHLIEVNKIQQYFIFCNQA